jgi:protein gp37
MNKQKKYKNGELISRGIEWTDFSWSPIAGCLHRCRWLMPDGKIARCYAEDIATGLARAAYPHGFDHHYWHGETRMFEPHYQREPSKIFLDSMSDFMGYWVFDHQIRYVLSTVRLEPQHTFQLLTKNPARLPQFRYPINLWVGVSLPPDFMWGNLLQPHQQERMLHKAFRTLEGLEDNTTWMSFEPLSRDVADIVAQYPGALDWAVIGAASNGRKLYQPEAEHVSRLLEVLDRQGVPVFMKGNLEWEEHREEWPNCL